MYKLLVLTKRKPGMSLQQFQDYYENAHARLVLRITPLMRKYRRNYLTPVKGGPGEAEEPPWGTGLPSLPWPRCQAFAPHIVG